MLTPSRKVVLLLPPYDGAPLGPPAGLLTIAAPLLEAGFDVQIIDAAVDPDWLQSVETAVRDALCLGVSLLTGPMIHGAVQASRSAKRVKPNLPVIYGGWHPTLLPEQTLAESSVDAVVRHQGELTFRELVQRLSKGHSLDGLAGCWHKADHEIRSNPDRPAPSLQDLPPLAYHLADFDAYERAGGGRKLPYATSVGCPYTCRYCTDTVFYNRRFDPYDVERTVAEVPALVRRHRIDEVALLDSNFLVNVRRAAAIAQGFLDSGVPLPLDISGLHRPALSHDRRGGPRAGALGRPPHRLRDGVPPPSPCCAPWTSATRRSTTCSSARGSASRPASAPPIT